MKLPACLCFLLCLTVLGEEPPKIEQVDETTFRVGKVTVNAEKQEARFPVTFLITDQLLEYLVVTDQGKVHESLLGTEARPLAINIALKLLDLRETPELFPLLDENYFPTQNYPEVTPEETAAARVELFLQWEADGETVEKPVHEVVQQKILLQDMPAQKWLYTGSYLEKGKFYADVTGNVIAIYLSKDALINYSGQDRDNDEVWLANSKVVPASGTEGELIVRKVTELGTGKDASE